MRKTAMTVFAVMALPVSVLGQDFSVDLAKATAIESIINEYKVETLSLESASDLSDCSIAFLYASNVQRELNEIAQSDRYYVSSLTFNQAVFFKKQTGENAYAFGGEDSFFSKVISSTFSDEDLTSSENLEAYVQFERLIESCTEIDDKAMVAALLRVQG